jgi:hypothetical protein
MHQVQRSLGVVVPTETNSCSAILRLDAARPVADLASDRPVAPSQTSLPTTQPPWYSLDIYPLAFNSCEGIKMCHARVIPPPSVPNLAEVPSS